MYDSTYIQKENNEASNDLKKLFFLLNKRVKTTCASQPTNEKALKGLMPFLLTTYPLPCYIMLFTQQSPKFPMQQSSWMTITKNVTHVSHSSLLLLLLHHSQNWDRPLLSRLTFRHQIHEFVQQTLDRSVWCHCRQHYVLEELSFLQPLHHIPITNAI